MHLTLRERNKRAAMRTIQAVALQRFVELGFDAVTIEQIAEEAGVGPMTVYRYFGTKERIVLWEEHDDTIDADLGARLLNQPSVDAIRDTFVETLAPLLDPEQLTRIQFAYRTPQIHGAALEDDIAARSDLTHALQVAMPNVGEMAAEVIAATTLTALDVAIDSWQRGDGNRPLADLIREAFDALSLL